MAVAARAVEAPAVEGAFDDALFDSPERERDAAMRTSIDERAGLAASIPEEDHALAGDAHRQRRVALQVARQADDRPHIGEILEHARRLFPSPLEFARPVRHKDICERKQYVAGSTARTRTAFRRCDLRALHWSPAPFASRRKMKPISRQTRSPHAFSATLSSAHSTQRLANDWRWRTGLERRREDAP